MNYFDAFESALKSDCRLIKAVFICPLCDKPIEEGQPYSKIEETSKGITHTKWAHKDCVHHAAGMP